MILGEFDQLYYLRRLLLRLVYRTSDGDFRDEMAADNFGLIRRMYKKYELHIRSFFEVDRGLSQFQFILTFN